MVTASDPRALVAPELLVGLDRLPVLELTEATIAAFRQSGRPSVVAQDVPPALAAMACEERMIPGLGDSPPVRTLIYRPPDASVGKRQAYLHIHGGGFVLGTPEINDLSNRAIAATLGCVVASVDYRLAPETRFPGARDDCYAVLAWLHAEAEALGVDRTRIAIGGESAGGGHAVALAIHARDIGECPIAFMLLDAPMLDDRTGTADAHPHCGRLVWTVEQNRFAWRSLLGREPGGADVPAEAAPARCEDLSGLPPAFISVGALDLFLEEDIEFARRLTRAGVAVEVQVIPADYHGFGVAGHDAPQVKNLLAQRMAALQRAFA